MVTLVTERADPDLGSEVDAREGVQRSRTRLAPKWRVRERGYVRVRTDRSDGSRQRNHTLAGFDFGPRPNVPRHPNGVHPFRIHVGHFRHG
ncbi:hypothetical protein GQ457_16G027870 [Hibiscus cannabinus]